MKYTITTNTILISILMFVMIFFSYFLIYKIPLYIFVLSFIIISLLFNNLIKFKFSKIEFQFFIYISFFILLIFIQYILYQNNSLFLSMASYISGLGIVLAIRYSVVSIKSMLFLIELFIIFQALIGVIAIIQAFTGNLYPSHFDVDPKLFSGLWNHPSGVEGMTYNFGKNYIFPTIFTFIALKYKLYNYSTFFTKKNLQLFLTYFIFIVVLSKTRSTQLSLFILYFIYYVYTRKLYKLKYIIFGIGLLLIIFLFVITHLDLFLDTSSKTRFVLWYAGLQMFLSHPLIGVGIGDFASNYQKIFQNISLDFIGDDYDHHIMGAHNILVTFLAEGGLIGVFLILKPFVKVLSYIKKYKFSNIQLKIISISIFYYFIAYFIDFQFHNYFNDNFYWFWIGILLALLSIDKKTRLVANEKKTN
jgi:O-antigen ligase